jgi:rare lipoprotein A
MVKIIHINRLIFLIGCLTGLSFVGFSQTNKEGVTSTTTTTTVKKKTNTRILYGQASFYAAKFEGRKTASGEIFRQSKLTAACNMLPLGTWIRVTNLRNGKSIVVRTNDRLHPKTPRIVDLTKTGAQKLGYASHGLTRVKVEVLNKKPTN